MTRDPGTESLLRKLAPQVLGAVVRRYGDFASAEDAVQDALLAAANKWPTDGAPDKGSRGSFAWPPAASSTNTGARTPAAIERIWLRHGRSIGPTRLRDGMTR